MPARHHRVTRGEDYRRAVRTGNRVGGAYCITYAVRRSAAETSDATPRFGYIISKAVGNAVTRNLVRRRMKAISDELIRDGAEGSDIVFRALPRAADATFAELRRELHRAHEKVRAQA
ncbi:ribonuclease P protein component [Leucobacter sp. G161]|uniref:ribonuclease P protein component n=1 Tax=Leucobacter sp. G161 TaxID=663704 RepID=UPI0009FB238C|nr:ribonuclease P protein component [Leucobacter sp. G161]